MPLMIINKLLKLNFFLVGFIFLFSFLSFPVCTKLYFVLSIHRFPQNMYVLFVSIIIYFNLCWCYLIFFDNLCYMGRNYSTAVFLCFVGLPTNAIFDAYRSKTYTIIFITENNIKNVTARCPSFMYEFSFTPRIWLSYYQGWYIYFFSYRNSC